jgi:hypothetical protein
MRHWQTDADLAGVRDKDALDKLPEDERKQWRQFWDDVADLLRRARSLCGPGLALQRLALGRAAS